MSLADDLLVSAASGVKVVSVNAPERDRFYEQLGKFLESEARADGMPERVVLVATNEQVGYFDWALDELNFDTSSNDCFARMATGKPSFNAGKFS